MGKNKTNMQDMQVCPVGTDENGKDKPKILRQMHIRDSRDPVARMCRQAVLPQEGYLAGLRRLPRMGRGSANKSDDRIYV